MAYTKNYEKKTLGEKKDEFYEDLTNRIIERMEGEVKYKKAWIVAEQLPYNPESGTVYSGANAVMLLSSGHADPRYLTFNQIQEASKRDGNEYRLKKGSKSQVVLFWAPFAQKDAQGNIMRDSEGKAINVRDENGNEKLTPKFFNVFNAEQIDGYPKLEIVGRDNPSFEPAEKMIEAMKADGLDFKHHTLDKAYYSPGQDAVRLPHKEAFESSEAYYRTAMHEIAHSTGHEKRLNRDHSGSMSGLGGDDLKKYAFEELVAELSSYYTGASIGVPYNGSVHDNHAGYLKSWLSVLKDETTGKASEEGIQFFKKACEQGKAATTYQLKALEKLELKLEQTKELKTEVVQEVKPEHSVERLQKYINPAPTVSVKQEQKRQLSMSM